MKTLFCRVVLVCLAALLIAGASYSQTQINGAASGNWSSTGSWSPATVPNNGGGNTYNVTLLSSPAVNITLDISPTIDTLTLDSGSILSTDSGTTLTTTGVTNGGDLELFNGNTLTVNGSMTTSNYFDLDRGSKLVVTGNLTNSSQLYTNIQDGGGAANTITVDGTFTNNSGATAHIGYFGNTADVMNVGTLSNSGLLYIDTGATLNLTNQANGVTDVVAGSELDVYGTFKAGTANGLAKLNSVEGVLVIGNGQTFTDTPGSGTLTNSNTLDLEEGSGMTVSGNLTNAGTLETNIRNQGSGKTNTLTVTGTFTNNSGATTDIGHFNDTTDVMNVATLVNNGVLDIDIGATLNLTSQPNGVTDVVAGSELDVYGTFKAGTANALAKLNSVEGTLVIGNSQTLADTPGSGTLTNSGTLDLEEGSSMTVSGNLTNSGILETNVRNQGSGKTNTLTVTGAFTNNSGATTQIGYFGDTTDVMNVATLVNNGVLDIDIGATLNLTSQPNGVTDVVAGSEIDVYGTFKAGSANALAKLNSIEGTLVLGNGQTLADTPGSGTLTNSGTLDLEEASTMTISGNLTNSGSIYTNVRNQSTGKTETLTVTGTFTNNSGATTHIGYFGDTTDVMNVATLVNNGFLEVDTGATLNLTNQPNGITDIGAGSELDVYGTIKAGSANGLAKLGSIEGTLYIGNGQTLTDTPGSGTLTNTGTFDLEENSNVTVMGNLTNSGGLYTDVRNQSNGDKNTLTVTGAFTNNSGATTNIGYFSDTTDVMNVATLVNNGTLQVSGGATLNLTNQPNGVTDVVAGSNLYLYGTFKAGANNALANLGSVEGSLILGNGQTTTATPGIGPLTISSVGQIDLELGSTLTVDGNLTNSGHLYTNVLNRQGGTNNINVTGTFNNALGATADLGFFGDSTAVMTVGTLTNAGFLSIGNTDTLVVANAGTITNTGTLNVGDTTGGGTLKISGNTTLTGTNGKVVLSNFASNIIEGAAGTDVLTVAKGQTIEGSGNIGNNSMGLNNQGIIEANQPTPLIIQISSGSTNSNSGTLEAANGSNTTGTLQLDAGTYTQTSTGNILATETGNALSAVNLESGVSIIGGKLTTTGTTATINLVGTDALLTLSGVTISGNGKLNLADGSTTTLLGTIANTGTIDVNGATTATSLKIGSATTSLTGTGKIIFTDNANNMITGTGTGDALTNANTIEGAVNINGIGLTNTGTIETLVHQVNELVINASSAGFNNQGTVEAATGTTLDINNASGQFLNFTGTTLAGGTYIVDGTLEFDGANIVTNNASITLSGAASKIISPTNTNALSGFATNNGTFAIASGRNFTTASNFTNNGTLNVGGGTKFLVGANGLDDLTNFSGGTLTGGTYIITGTLQFDNGGFTSGIVTNDANITLSGTAAKILQQTGVSAIANLATNASGATFQVTSGNIFTTAGNFTNNGTLIVGSTTSKFIVNSADSLTNFSGTTLTGGTYDLTGLLQFAGANIVTNAANITLTATSAAIENSTGGNGLANFATNNAGATFDVTGGKVFTTGGNFTNNGTLTVGSTSSKFIVNSADSLTNFSGNTLTGGTYNLTGVLQFAGANIVNNAANITLTGTSSAIENSTGGNGLTGFANNTSTGSFTLAGNRTFTTVGAFTNAGAMIINKGSTFTVLTGTGNNYSQSGGSTTVDGTLTVGATDAVNITGGNLFGATGNINGNVDLTGGVVNPGDGANLIGELKITGTYTQGSAGAATIDLGGKTAITQYSVLDITKAASLSGTLNVNLVNGFTPTVGNTFTILDYLSETGSFTTLNLPTVSGDHWTVTYNAKDVVLTLVAGPGPAVIVDNLTSDPASSTAAPVTVSASPARRVSRGAGVLASTPSTHEPVAILSHVTCFAARLLGSASCGDHSVATTASGLGAVHNNVMPASAGLTSGAAHNNVMPATASPSLGAAHNNVMVATRSISSARGGASNEPSASASAMARLYVCAYMPSSVARTMGCSN
jgi:fibronectin-binding autotransporter adhesin